MAVVTPFPGMPEPSENPFVLRAVVGLCVDPLTATVFGTPDLMGVDLKAPVFTAGAPSGVVAVFDGWETDVAERPNAGLADAADRLSAVRPWESKLLITRLLSRQLRAELVPFSWVTKVVG